MAALATIVLSGCAPTGTHYGNWAEGPVAALTTQPNDPCMRAEMRSPAMLAHLNASAGKVGGPSVRAVAVLETIGGGQGITLGCRASLRLENGQTESGTISIRSPEGNGQLIVNFESDAARERREDTPERRAIQKFCTTATAQGCAMYQQDVLACRGLSSSAYGILKTQRFWRSKGSSPEEAARLSIEGQGAPTSTLGMEMMSRHNVPSASASDLQTIAKRAMIYPATAPPESFSETIFNDCVARS